MTQENISSKERASIARQEKAKALQGLFNNCFKPTFSKEETETLIQPENRQSENRQPENRQPENRQSENRQSENRQPENRQFIKSPFYGKLISLVQEISLSSIGLLAILIEKYPSGEGRINIQHFAETCGMSKSALKAQIHALERKGLIELGATQNNGERAGRDLKIMFLINDIGDS